MTIHVGHAKVAMWLSDSLPKDVAISLQRLAEALT